MIQNKTCCEYEWDIVFTFEEQEVKSVYGFLCFLAPFRAMSHDILSLSYKTTLVRSSIDDARDEKGFLKQNYSNQITEKAEMKQKQSLMWGRKNVLNANK